MSVHRLYARVYTLLCFKAALKMSSASLLCIGFVASTSCIVTVASSLSMAVSMVIIVQVHTVHEHRPKVPWVTPTVIHAETSMEACALSSASPAVSVQAN